MHKFQYSWKISDTKFETCNGKVFSCFSGGGGSSMGYKLAGFDVIGCNDIDKRMIEAYISNLTPKYVYCSSIKELVNTTNIPPELYDLDILDGSPPCSAFSIMGLREKSWGVERKFREGQATQVLDTLFFDFIDFAKKIQPKIVIAENVKGIKIGKAIKYVDAIHERFSEAGYKSYDYLLSASDMGVPQIRQRVFFVAIRNELKNQLPDLQLQFNEKPITLGEFADYTGRPISGKKQLLMYHLLCEQGMTDHEAFEYITGQKNNNGYNFYKFISPDKVANTFVAHRNIFHAKHPIHLSRDEVAKICTFPTDYKCSSKNEFEYICSMSVPPVMMAQVASQVYQQWLSKLKDK